jgi:hypothetical protein
MLHLCYVLLQLHYLWYIIDFFPDNYDTAEAKTFFDSNYSHIYYIFNDNFATVEADLKQRGEMCFDWLNYCINVINSLFVQSSCFFNTLIKCHMWPASWTNTAIILKKQHIIYKMLFQVIRSTLCIYDIDTESLLT